MEKVIEIVSENQLEQVLSNSQHVVLDFWASWCGPCRQLMPLMNMLAEENSNLTVCKVNVNDQEALAAKYGVTSIPAVFLFKDGDMKYNFKGFMGKKPLTDLIKQHLGV